jgi:hypothetical protein
LYVVYLHNPDDPPDGYEAVKRFVDEQKIAFRLIPLVAGQRVNGIGHWNASGHRQAAETVVEMLIEPVS